MLAMMFGTLASLFASLAVLVLPVSAPCACHGFAFFGAFECISTPDESDQQDESCCDDCETCPDAPAPEQKCPYSEHQEAMNLILPQPTLLALSSLDSCVATNPTWIDPSNWLSLQCICDEEHSNYAKTDWILSPPPLRFIEPVRLLI